MTTQLFITGASGFVGRAIVSEAMSRGTAVVPVYRQATSLLPTGAAVIDSIGSTTDWSSILSITGNHKNTTVVHCAGIAGSGKRLGHEAHSRLNEVNVEGTRRLAEQAAKYGVRRFVFISSVKVHGERTEKDGPFAWDSAIQPESLYAISKWAAENALNQIAERAKMELVVVRPPIIYGPGMQGNLLRLLRLVERGVPIPLGAVDNRRSMVSIDNFVDLVLTATVHPAAAGRVLMVADGEDLSTADLIKMMAGYLGSKQRLISVPVPLIVALSRATGFTADLRRLVDSLIVDSRATTALLGWTPKISVAEGIRRLVHWYSVNQ